MTVFPLSLTGMGCAGQGWADALITFYRVPVTKCCDTASLPGARLSVDESYSGIKIFATGFGTECSFGSGGMTVHASPSHLLGSCFVSRQWTPG